MDRRRLDPAPEVAGLRARRQVHRCARPPRRPALLQPRRDPGETHLHVPLPPREQRRRLLQGDQPSLPDDRDAVADALHLGEDVRRKEDGPAFGLEPVEDLVERALHQRVEALGRLVENRQLGIVLQRLDDADLLAHAARVVADKPLERRTATAPAARTARGGARTDGRSARRDSRAASLRSGSRRARCRPAGSRSGGGSPRCRARCRDRARGRGRQSDGEIRAAGGSSCSSRLRSDPGSRRPHLTRTTRSRDSSARTWWP